MRDTVDKGKNKVDDTGQAKHAVTHQKPLDFVRLSSESTPENPRMLGGTKEAAQAYFNGLSEADKQAFYDYKDFKQKCTSSGDPHPTKTASNAYPHGYQLYLEWDRRRNRAPGESSTQDTPKKQNTPKRQETWDEWYDRVGYPR